MKEQKKNTRSRKYLLTINNPKDHNMSHEQIKALLTQYHYRYIAICDETGEQGTYHSHVYVCFENAILFSTLKKLFPTANILTAYGTSKENRNYLLKSAPNHNKDSNGFYKYKDSTGNVHSGQNHTETFEEYGECPEEEQGRRTDLEYMYALIKDGLTNAEILELCPNTAIKHIDKINKLRHSYLTDKFKGQRRLDLKVHYICGDTGLGKSRDILDEHGDENVYRVTDEKHPFDSYQNEPIIVFEEFRSSQKLSDMLNYLDVYPCSLPARYSPKVACYHTVYVVSNWDFELQYAELQKNNEQKASYFAWIRRFNGFVKVYKKEGIKTYNTIYDYLKRNETFHTPDEPTPFDASDDEAMPFD